MAQDENDSRKEKAPEIDGSTKGGLYRELDNIIYFVLIIGCLLADHYLNMGDMTLVIGALLMKARAA